MPSTDRGFLYLFLLSYGLPAVLAFKSVMRLVELVMGEAFDEPSWLAVLAFFVALGAQTAAIAWWVGGRGLGVGGCLELSLRRYSYSLCSWCSG